ncbi:hypothetical protein ACH4FX_10565 [Streptomyces sp. NPDC018019]|uniref:hypothetical protein n=1 Tax=Streptomyces sp. NPDC018019 TaxID=3365030 RepID=UPI0037AE99D9
MSSATITPGTLHPTHGATALGPAAADGAPRSHEQRHIVGNVFRAVKVFAAAAVSVVLLGEYAED